MQPSSPRSARLVCHWPRNGASHKNSRAPWLKGWLSRLACCSLLSSMLVLAPMAHATQFYNKGAEAGLPFSLAVRAGDYIFISGQLGLGPNGLAKGLEAQSKQAMDNIAAILKAHNLNMDDLVKCTVMLTDMSKWADFNRIYTAYFKPERLPARSAMGVTALAMGGEVEIECIAYLPRRL